MNLLVIGTMRYSLHKQASASLKSGLDLKEIVKLPDNEDIDDWIAVHGRRYEWMNERLWEKIEYVGVLVVDFFNRINLVYGIITDYCTRESCPTMSGGPRYEYRYVVRIVSKEIQF